MIDSEIFLLFLLIVVVVFEGMIFVGVLSVLKLVRSCFCILLRLLRFFVLLLILYYLINDVI